MKLTRKKIEILTKNNPKGIDTGETKMDTSQNTKRESKRISR